MFFNFCPQIKNVFRQDTVVIQERAHLSYYTLCTEQKAHTHEHTQKSHKTKSSFRIVARVKQNAFFPRPTHVCINL